MTALKGTIRQAALFGITALFGGLVGFVIAAGNGITFDGHDHNSDHGAGHNGQHVVHDKHAETSQPSHEHDMLIELDPDSNIPTLSIQLHTDPVTGYNLHILTTNFQFSGANSGLQHQEGEGHAHLYIDGVKQARLYGAWTHLAAIPEDASQLTVSLNSNDHRGLSVNGQPLEASVTLDIVR